MDANKIARLRLALIPGLGPVTQLRLVQHFGSAAAIFQHPAEVARVLGPAAATALAQGADPKLLERTLEWQAAPSHHLVTIDEEAYPPVLREIHDPPGLLYAIGEVAFLRRPCVAIVGSRNATTQGTLDARAVAGLLSAAGQTIVSGLALGIDAAAHEGGLDGGSSSIAVIGTGADICYPRRNRALAQRLASCGCIVTEFPLGTPPVSGNFPRRNRLISGLARAVLVVEANENSGSLLTAYSALEQNREVLAMPGSIHSPLAKGCHKLLKEGAALAEDANDVLDALRLPRIERAAAEKNNQPQSPDSLLHALGFAPLSPDQIALRTGLAPAAVAARLTRLQIEGRVEQVSGGKFQRVERAS
ncbi:MAG TPA: DNA-processing protein DprA [Usitatibacter sp.]|nr:DNA-processing protein DprA [Usitatibacter sp.]